MVDIWFLFCIFSAAIVIVLHVILDSTRNAYHSIQTDRLINSKSCGNQQRNSFGLSKKITHPISDYYAGSDEPRKISTLPHNCWQTENSPPFSYRFFSVSSPSIIGKIVIAIIFIVFNSIYWYIVYQNYN